MLDTREKLLDIREKLDGRLLVGDGAIGTFLDDRGVDQPYYKANLTHARIVRAVHEEYLRAGARVNRDKHLPGQSSQARRPESGGEGARDNGRRGTPGARSGAYLMPPASMPYLAGDVVEAIN